MTTKTTAISVLVLEGLASSGLQMITIRQTMPFVGSSVLCTSIVISCFLAALALGYYAGGKQPASQYNRKLVTNLVWSIGLYGIGLSYVAVSLFFTSLASATEGLPILSSPLVHLFLFSALVMGPLVYLLGQTVPLLLNTADQEKTKSEATGNATALSTIGNVVGCLLTSLVLMYYLGVGYSILVNCGILIVCLGLLFDWKRKEVVPAAIIASAAIALIFLLNVRLPEQVFEATTAYSNIRVVEDTERRRLVINRSLASSINPQQQGWKYIELIKEGLFSQDMAGKKILVLGAGGFSLSAEDTHGAQFTYVDVDKALKPVAEEMFLKQPINGEFIAMDARAFLLQDKRHWDAIVVDLYANGATIPSHTATFEFFSLVGTKLTEKGRIFVNIVANPLLKDRYSKNMDYTVRQALSPCVTDLTSFEDRAVNIIYFCSQQPAAGHQQAAGLYVDDRTEVTVDGLASTM